MIGQLSDQISYYLDITTHGLGNIYHVKNPPNLQDGPPNYNLVYKPL